MTAPSPTPVDTVLWELRLVSALRESLLSELESVHSLRVGAR